MATIFNWIKTLSPLFSKVLPILNLIVYLFAGFGMYQFYYTLTGKDDTDIVCSKYNTKETTKDITKRELAVDETYKRQERLLEILRNLDKEETKTITKVDTLPDTAPSTDTDTIVKTTSSTLPKKLPTTIRKTPSKHRITIAKKPTHKKPTTNCTYICLTKAEIELLRKTAETINKRILSNV